MSEFVPQFKQVIIKNVPLDVHNRIKMLCRGVRIPISIWAIGALMRQIEIDEVAFREGKYDYRK